MTGKTIAILLMALLATLPTVAASEAAGDEDVRMNCNGEPTGDPNIDFRYRFVCNTVSDTCNALFNPCPIE